jgi:aspartyl-tRNA(Asn)/glutamyl-tRNA(Gln) amidotransferase subunit B
MQDFEAVIGLETHIQLNTRSKVFCACKADSWGDPPNTNICPVCTGLPGVLPTLNRAVVERAVLLAAALKAEHIQERSYFARKNYFYPDLPKGYQISQYDEPLAIGGRFDVPLPDGSMRSVGIIKLHIEEDAGKTVYANGQRLIDFNRCGVPLVEMVSGPDLRSADEAATYIIRLRQLVRWLGICEGDMEKGHLRTDANVSIRPVGSGVLYPKTEIKNLNSIEAMRAAVLAEIERQVREVRAGGHIETWTLNWDEETGSLSKMRSKESEADYRYFREPDLLPINLSAGWREEIVARMPELPLERRNRFVEEHGLPLYDAEILTEEKSLADYFEQTVATFAGAAKTVSNWLMNDVLRMLRDQGLTAAELRLKPQDLAQIIRMVEERKITATTGKELLELVQRSGKSPGAIVKEQGLAQVSDEDTLRALAAQVIAESPEQVATYQGGKQTVIGWFVGQLMRKTQGKANPQLARAILEELLQS